MEEVKSNRQKKKEAATIHNNTMSIAENLFPIGHNTANNGDLFMYLKSNEENIFNVYNTESEDILDLRKIDENKDVKLFFGPSAIMKTLAESYGEDTIDRLQL